MDQEVEENPTEIPLSYRVDTESPGRPHSLCDWYLDNVCKNISLPEREFLREEPSRKNTLCPALPLQLVKLFCLIRVNVFGML